MRGIERRSAKATTLTLQVKKSCAKTLRAYVEAKKERRGHEVSGSLIGKTNEEVRRIAKGIRGHSSDYVRHHNERVSNEP
jgi:hypothetical protein